MPLMLLLSVFLERQRETDLEMIETIKTILSHTLSCIHFFLLLYPLWGTVAVGLERHETDSDTNNTELSSEVGKE